MDNSRFINRETLDALKSQTGELNTQHVAEIGKSVGEIIEFLNQLKLYVEAEVKGHDQKILDLRAVDALQNHLLKKQIRRLANFVFGLSALTVGMAVYLCLHH